MNVNFSEMLFEKNTFLNLRCLFGFLLKTKKCRFTEILSCGKEKILPQFFYYKMRQKKGVKTMKTKKQKIISILTTFIVLFSLLVFADEIQQEIPPTLKNEKTVSLRIEGISENKLYEKEKVITYETETLTVADVLKSVLSEEDYIYETSEYGGYFSSLFGETENTFEYDYDGWQFRINGEKTTVGADSCEVNDNDEILFYYGPMSIAYLDTPVVTYKSDGMEIAFTYEKTTYDEFWNATVATVPLDNAVVTWYYSTDSTEEFTTDENGKIYIPYSLAEAGAHKIQIDKKGDAKKDDVFVPLVVRFAPDFVFSVIEQPAPPVYSGGGGSYIPSKKDKEEKDKEKEGEKLKDEEEAETKKEAEEEPLKSNETVHDAPDFQDIKGHWAEDYIIKLAQKGYINGKTKETFVPEASISRAEYIAIVYRMSEDADFKKEEEFSDVSENDWFFEAVCWAKEKGIVNGTSVDEFSPNDSITREQLAVISAKYISYKKLELKETKDIKKFNDEAEISSWAYEYTIKLAQFGILTGNENGAFMPKNNTKRAEAAKILSYLITE